MKKAISLIIIFFLLLYSAHPLKVFTVEETAILSLATKAQDLDSDLLMYVYSEPLNASGEWQTDYGDAGSYNSSVTVSDGKDATTERILIIVTKKQIAPKIDSFDPESRTLEVNEGKSLEFFANASDLNLDMLFYEWKVDGKRIATQQEFSYSPSYADSGHHLIELVVSDGSDEAVQAWNVLVNDVNIDSLFDSIRDVHIEETDIASLNLPDFSDYGLRIEISEPLGSDNLWQTGYDDGGDYPITVYATGKGYERKKTIALTVTNKDRPPTITIASKEPLSIAEHEEIKLSIMANDPDGDSIQFDIANLPNGAVFSNGSFLWTPTYDEIQKQGPLDYVLDRFRLLSKTKTLEFEAISKNTTSKETVSITIRDVNQPFVWQPMETVIVNEGELIELNPSIIDPDHDSIDISYSGFMVTNKKQTNFESAGNYVVKIKASDGYYTQTQFVIIIINNVNRKPSFNEMKPIALKEGEQATIELQATDPDSDPITFSSDDLPNGAKIVGNKLIWTPPFDLTQNVKEMSITITADDGIDSTKRLITLTVMHVNAAPLIETFSNSQVVLIDETIPFEVVASDIDQDVLTYTWKFGLLDSYVGESTHARKFSSPGVKDVEVVVSDGKASVSKKWTVHVIG